MQGGGEICISIEYDTTGPDPVKGDIARILQIGHPMDVYPLDPHKVYRVDHVGQCDHNVLVLVSHIMLFSVYVACSMVRF
jgi:hypothetical protein